MDPRIRINLEIQIRYRITFGRGNQSSVGQVHLALVKVCAVSVLSSF